MRLSLDNGLSYISVSEALCDPRLNMDSLVLNMDNDVLDYCNLVFAPCSHYKFISEYLKRAPCDLVIS